MGNRRSANPKSKTLSVRCTPDDYATLKGIPAAHLAELVRAASERASNQQQASEQASSNHDGQQQQATNVPEADTTPQAAPSTTPWRQLDHPTDDNYTSPVVGEDCEGRWSA